MKAKAIYHNYYARSAHSAAAEHKAVSTWSGSTRARNSQPSSSVVATPGRKLVVTLSLPPDKLRTIFFRTSSHIAQKRARDGAGRFLPGAMFGGSDDCESDDEWTLSKRRRASQRYRRSNANHGKHRVVFVVEVVFQADSWSHRYRVRRFLGDRKG
jgi:hypothetical protein